MGFYSGAKKLLDLLGDGVEIICGISSVVYFMSKIGLSWDDTVLVSAHGKKSNLISHISHNEKVFSILGTTSGIAELSRKLVNYGMGNVLLYVGENLSYENEKIFSAKASDLTEYIVKNHTGFNVSGACYPEVHQEAANMVEDIKNLKKKL